MRRFLRAELGDGIEPGDIQPFVQGDRVKQVNWRASLRLGTLYVIQHCCERNADVVLMLDTLASVGAPSATTLDGSIRAAASLAAAYLARKDRVGLIEYGGYGGLLLERRRALHARIVEELGRLHEDRLAEQVETLAPHALRGEVWQKGVGYLLQADIHMFGRSANREAVQYLEQALDPLHHLPAGAGRTEQEIDLRFLLRHALLPLGDTDRTFTHLREALGDHACQPRRHAHTGVRVDQRPASRRRGPEGGAAQTNVIRARRPARRQEAPASSCGSLNGRSAP